MRAVGIICEFNPFHEGHAHLLREGRRTVGEDGCVVCVMSGRFVQRGEPAMFDPYLRAKCALLGGADLVVELPFPWSAASAEHFAAAGVHIAASLGVDALAFGSESGDSDLLRRGAAVVSDPAFGERYARLCREGRGTAAAFAEVLSAALGSDLPAGFPASNDFLGIAYFCALEKRRAAVGTAPAATVIRREGAGYRDDVLSATGYPSATALRLLCREAAGDTATLAAMLDGTMPPAALAALLDAMDGGNAPIEGDRLLPFYHAYYRLQSQEAIGAFAECGGGLAGQICRQALDAATPAEFFHSLRAGRYTDARLRRAMLFGAVGVTAADVHTMPDHTVLLGANERGRAYLKAWQKSADDAVDFGVVTKPADAPEGRQRDISRRADALFTLCYPEPKEAGELTRRSPVIR